MLVIGTRVPRRSDASRLRIEFAQETLSSRIGGTPIISRRGGDVRFSLPKDDQVRLAVYDVRGRQVAVLLNGEWFRAGDGLARWTPAAPVTRGIYFLRLETRSGLRASRKIVVLE